MDKVNLDAWLAHQVEETAAVPLHTARQIAATFGDDAERLRDGDPLPALGHWCGFSPLQGTAALRSDGHPQDATLLPPTHLKRRMWAGGALTFHRPLRIGEPIRRRSRLTAAAEKTTKAGPMLLATLDHAHFGDTGLAISERQDIVFLDIPDSYAPPEKRAQTGTPVGIIPTSETLLFRYSALTFNAHRIHYDLSYTREVEHYPGLVVHGPLQATLLLRAAVAHRGRAPLMFDFRAVHPMFAGSDCQITLQDDDEGTLLWTGQDGHQCMQARAVWEETQ